MEITTELKHNIREAMLKGKENFSGTHSAYAKSLGIDFLDYYLIRKGEIEKVTSPSTWFSAGRKLQVSAYDHLWKTARTEVYTQLEDNFHFCQQHQVSMILVDDCGIGKTYCAKIIISQMKNAFYIDASQSQSKIRLIRQLAVALGCDTTGKYYEILENVKYAINILENPFICIDEAGDLEYTAYLELKGIINATESNSAWYMIGADGLRSKITKGINNHKVGFAEIFSRFSDDFVTLVPRNPEQRKEFYVKLFGDVAFVNIADKRQINKIVKSCMVKIDSPYKTTRGQDGRIRSLRYLKTIIKVRG